MGQWLEKVSVRKALGMVANGALLVDVRPLSLWKVRRLKGAMSLPYDSLSFESADAVIPSLDTPLVVYCEMGVLSEMAAKHLKSLGYTDVVDAGPIGAWPDEFVEMGIEA